MNAPTEKELYEAYCLGESDRENGHGRYDENPYEDKSELSREYERGWDDTDADLRRLDIL